MFASYRYNPLRIDSVVLTASGQMEMRQGIPYNTLHVNMINHPNPDGMRLFADSLMWLLP